MARSEDRRCKGCGLMVQPGYAKCPRCKMPQAKTAAERKAQGGTAVEGSSKATVVALGLLAVVVVVIVMARGDDADKTSNEIAPPVIDTQATPPVQVNTTPVDTGEVGFTGTETEEEGVKGSETVLRSLEDGLAERRLWSQVRTERQSPKVVNVVSASCSDERMKATLEGTSAQLKDIGFTSLRCVEKHGALVFEIEF